jgi:Family of unknown function (DUF6527)
MRDFWSYLLKFVRTRSYLRRKVKVVRVRELPDTLKKYTMYTIGEDIAWLVALQCPCGCSDIVQLTLLKQESPRWSLQQEKDGSATIFPSVWRSKGCKSHFFIRRGLVLWCDIEHN